MKMKTRKGFTLTELLIVMAIIVVLAAVAIPTFGRQLETSRETADMEIIRNAYTEVLTYAAQDGADGKLDGYLGGTSGTPLPTAGGIKATTAQSTAGGNAIYTIIIATAFDNAKFSQNGTGHANESASVTGAWSYVNNQLMGCTVPPVNTTVKSLAFTFKFGTTGEVELVPVSVTGVTGTTALFTPGSMTEFA